MLTLWHVLMIVTGPFVWGLLFGWLTHPIMKALVDRWDAKRSSGPIIVEHKRRGDA